MKKKLLISTHTLNIGGVERSFIGLLEHLDYSKYEVDVFVYQHHGELFDLVPKEANVLPEIRSYSLLLEPISQSVKEKKWGVVYAKLATRLITKWKGLTLERDAKKSDSLAHPILYKTARNFLPQISSKNYDAVLAFLHPNYFEREKAKASQYFAWIHTDYSFLNIDRNAELKMWKQYDQIFGVSKGNVEAFGKIFPELRPKLMVFENILSKKFVEEQSLIDDATNEMAHLPGVLNFLSIGRFSYQKNFESIPFIAQILKGKGINFIWYLIGYGSPDEQIKIEQAILQTGMQKHVKILGKRNNPYPYIRKCDIYIQPSRFEGKAVTIREAQILGKPVVITDFASSSSQLSNGIDGIVVPMEIKECADQIAEFVTDSSRINNIVRNINERDYTNVSEMKKLITLLNATM